MWFLFWEGAFAMAYETWIGPTYFSGVAGELGVSVAWVGLLTAIPAIGQVAQLLGLWHFHKASSVKNYVVTLAWVARALWAIPVFSAWYWGIHCYLSHEAFPATRWFLLTAFCSCASSVIAASSGVAWMAWVRDMIPQSFRGRFFGVRQRYTNVAIVAAHGLAVFLVGWKPAGLQLGFAILLTLALICAAASTVLLGRVRDIAPQRRDPDSLDTGLTLSSLLEPFRDRRFRSLVIFGAAFNLMVQLAGPFFPYYFTSELKLPMSTVSLWTVLTYLGWVIASVYWGKTADRKGRLGFPFWGALHLIAISPAFYILASQSVAQYIGPIDYFTNGIFWAGYTLVLTTLLLEACPPEKCGLYYSIYAASNGLAGATGSLIGGQVAVWLAPHGGFRTLWAVAALLRLGVVWVLHPLLRHGSSSGSDSGSSGKRGRSSQAEIAQKSDCEAHVEPVASYSI